MDTIDWTVLQTETEAVLVRVEAGGSLVIELDGSPVATLEPIERRLRFVSRVRFISEVMSHRADPPLRADLRDLAPDMTDGRVGIDI